MGGPLWGAWCGPSGPASEAAGTPDAGIHSVHLELAMTPRKEQGHLQEQVLQMALHTHAHGHRHTWTHMHTCMFLQSVFPSSR